MTAYLKNSFDTAEQDGFQKAEELYAPLLEEAQKREAEARQRLINLVKMLKSTNVPIEQIAKETGFSVEEIEKL